MKHSQHLPPSCSDFLEVLLFYMNHNVCLSKNGFRVHLIHNDRNTGRVMTNDFLCKIEYENHYACSLLVVNRTYIATVSFLGLNTSKIEEQVFRVVTTGNPDFIFCRYIAGLILTVNQEEIYEKKLDKATLPFGKYVERCDKAIGF